MADKKISQLTNLTGANLADNDEFVLVDTSADETKAITWSELKEGLDTGTGFVRITGDTMTGDLSFGDNDKAIFGAGSDLQIYHNGSNSYLDEVGTGNLFVRANNLRLSNADNSQYYLIADNSGFVKLNYAGATKLATTSTGIDVTGTVTADGLTVDGNNNIQINRDGVSSAKVFWNRGSTQDAAIELNASEDLNISVDDAALGGKHLNLLNNNKLGFRLSDGGDISFYEDTGTTPKFFWDSSAESLELSNSAASSALKITKGNTTGNALEIINSGESRSIDINHNADGTGTVDDIVRIKNNGTSVFEIDSSGNVGIGTSSPSDTLSVVNLGSSGTGTQISSGTSSGDLRFKARTESYNGIVSVYDSGSNEDVRISAHSGVSTYFNSGSNVGIGTDSPDRKLHVSGSSTLAQFESSTSGVYLELKNSGGNAAYIGSTSGSNLVVETGGSERMRIDSSGNVGIGTTSPSASLHVANPNNTTVPAFIESNINAVALNIGSRTGSDFGNIGFTSEDGATPLAMIGSVGDSLRIFTGGNTSERMRIDSSGNVGIGTTSPSEKLHLYDTTSSIFINEVASGGGGVASWRLKHGTSHWGAYVGTTDNLIFYDYGASAERMRIDSSGNVGIGVTPPAWSVVGPALTVDNVSLASYSTGSIHLSYLYNNIYYDGANEIYEKTGKGALFQMNGDNFLWFNAPSGTAGATATLSERMRITSSGSLLVAKSSQADGATAGHEFLSDGRFYHTKSGDHVGRLNRLSTDGDILRFAKDGSTVGTIGNKGGDLYIGTGDTGLSFYDFSTDNAIFPHNPATNSPVDASIDLGRGVSGSAYRFKDLYLSGGVYLGGTGSANKLDDYEEGTWTPTFNSSTFATGITVNNAHYVKIGDLVNITATLAFTGTTGNFAVGDNYSLGGLPFSMSDTYGRTGSGWASASTNRVGFNNLAQLTYISGNVTSVYGTLARSYAVTITITYRITAT